MKKLSLILCFFVIFSSLLYGCNDIEENDSTISEHADFEYYSMEESLNSSTHILKVKCIDISFPKNDPYYKIYQFQVLESLLGETSEDTIFVYCRHKGLVHTSNGSKRYSYVADPFYEKGEIYYLPLKRKIDVYSEHDKYLADLALIKIPVSNIQNSTMYGEPLIEHSKISSLETEQDVKNYIVEYLENNPNPDRLSYLGRDYIKSDDLNTIVDNSDYVVKIKVEDFYRETDDQIFYYCTVKECLKGDLEVGEKIRVRFKKNDVIKGWTYILTATEAYDSPKFLLYSAKDSVYTVLRENQITKYLSD